MDGKTPVLWKVALSNGETHVEGAGLFVEVDGERSPWGRLSEYLSDTGAIVTALSLWTKEGQTWNLPPCGKGAPRFRFFDGQKPVDFDAPEGLTQFGVVGAEGGDTEAMVVTEHFKVIEAYYGIQADGAYRGVRLTIWVDADDTRNSWSLVRFEG